MVPRNSRTWWLLVRVVCSSLICCVLNVSRFFIFYLYVPGNAFLSFFFLFLLFLCFAFAVAALLHVHCDPYLLPGVSSRPILRPNLQEYSSVPIYEDRFFQVLFNIAGDHS